MWTSWFCQQLNFAGQNMNIIMVCESALVSGGAEKVAIQESVELTKRGYRVGYIAGNDLADHRLTASGVEVLLLDTKSFFEETDRARKVEKLRGNFDIEPAVVEFLSSFEPGDTIIHLHTFRLRLSGIVAHIAQEMGFATVIHVHDYSAICPTSLWYDHRMGVNCSRRPMSFGCITCECQNQSWKYKLPKLSSFFWNQSVWKIYRNAKAIIHISRLERETVALAGDLGENEYQVPPISSYQSLKRVEAEQNESYVFVGRLTHEKGIEVLLEATYQNGKRAVVVGDGPLREALSAKFPLARFTGWIDETAILNEFKQARALVVPSLWRETLCLSVIDAMQMGVPCIVSEHVGAKEFITTGENGLIFVDGTLSDCLEKSSSDPFIRNLSENAFASLQKVQPSIKYHVDALIPIYEGCVPGVAY